jgi:hypothetical protein
VPTYRHEKFAAYQGGREFDDASIEQLEVLPEFVAACGFATAKAPGYESDDFLAAGLTMVTRFSTMNKPQYLFQSRQLAHGRPAECDPRTALGSACQVRQKSRERKRPCSN